MSGQQPANRSAGFSRADLIGVGALVLLTLAFFWRAVLGLGVFFHGDILAQFQPYKQILHESLRAGRLPLWSPLFFCGYPLAAEGQTGVFYPPGLLISWPLPAPAAITSLIVAHILLAALGMYALARRLGHSPFAAWLSGFVFGFSGYLFAHLHHIGLLCAAAWLPLLILAAERAVRGPLLPAAALGAGAWALIGLAGHPPTLFYASLAVIFWLAWRAVELRRSTAGVIGRAVASFAIIFALGGLLAAVQLLPTLALIRQGAARGIEMTRLEYVTSLSLLPKHLLGLLAPNWQGTPALGTYRGEEFYWEYVCYLGLLPLALAAVGASGRRGRMLLALALGALLFALAQGNPLYRALQYVPGFSHLRAAARFLYLFTFAGALLAGLGWDRLAGLRVLAAGRRRAVLIALVAALSVADLLVFDRTLAPLASPTLYREPGPVAGALMADRSWHRVAICDPDRTHANWVPRGGWYGNPGAYLAERQRLVADVPAAYGIPMLDGYTAFVDPRPMHFMGMAFGLAAEEANVGALSLAGVRYCVGGENVAYLPLPRRTVGSRIVYRNPGAFPRAFVVGAGLPARSLDAALEGTVLLARVGRLRQAAMIEGAASLPRRAQAPHARITLRTPRPEHIRVAVRSDTEGVLVLNERAAPGWVVRLDGRRAPALIADGLLLATPLPAGRHTVEFRYRPRPFLVGRALTAVGLLAWLALVVGPRRRYSSSISPGGGKENDATSSPRNTVTMKSSRSKDGA